MGHLERIEVTADKSITPPFRLLAFCLAISSIPIVAAAQKIDPIIECPREETLDSDYQQQLQESIAEYLRENPEDEHFQVHLIRSTGEFSKMHVAIWSGCLEYAERVVAARQEEGKELSPVLDRPWHAFEIMLNPPTPMTYAINRGRPEFVQFLIEKGADMTATEPWLRRFHGAESQWPSDMTYFHQAALSENADIISVLRAYDPAQMQKALDLYYSEVEKSREALRLREEETERIAAAVEAAKNVPNEERLTLDEARLLSEPILKIWREQTERLASPGLEGGEVTVRFRIRSDGRVDGSPELVSAMPQSPVLFQIARRAILRSQPFVLPTDRIIAGVDLELHFQN